MPPFLNSSFTSYNFRLYSCSLSLSLSLSCFLFHFSKLLLLLCPFHNFLSIYHLHFFTTPFALYFSHTIISLPPHISEHLYPTSHTSSNSCPLLRPLDSSSSISQPFLHPSCLLSLGLYSCLKFAPLDPHCLIISRSNYKIVPRLSCRSTSCTICPLYTQGINGVDKGSISSKFRFVASFNTHCHCAKLCAA